MNRDVLHTLSNIDGTPLLEGDKPVTVRAVLVAALLANTPGESAEDKITKFNLATLIQKMASPILTTEQLALLKKTAGTYCSVLAYGQIAAWADA